MTAQERTDVRRVQESRETWKKRAVRRGEDRRRCKERRNAVDRSRPGWRDRALAAEHRVEPLEVEHQQLQSALTRAPAPSPIDNAPFFSVLGLSLWGCTVPARSAPRATFAVHFFWLRLAALRGCLTARQVVGGPCVSASMADNRRRATAMRRGGAAPLCRCRGGARQPSSG